MNVYQVDGEDLIVANSIAEARRLFREHHGESCRGRDIRQLAGDHSLTLQEGMNEDIAFSVKVEDYVRATPQGYYPAAR